MPFVRTITRSGEGKILSILELNGRVSAMKLSSPWRIATQGAFIVNDLQQTDYQHTENIDVDLGIFGELI
jgi:hypothetical protein